MEPLLEDKPLPQTPNQNRFSRFQGWRASIALCTCGTFIVLLCNATLLIAALRADPDTRANGLVTIYEGSCNVTKSMSTWLHLLINILSTCLLTASNVAMHCILAPTREDIDNAHAAGRWLQVGVLSFGNAKHLSRARVFFASLLIISSLPLHTLYNSVIFSSVGQNDYIILLVRSEFLQGSPWSTAEADISFPQKIFNGALDPDFVINDDTIAGLKDLAQTEMQHIDTLTCVETYGQQKVPNRGSVILVREDGDPYADRESPNDSNSSLLNAVYVDSLNMSSKSENLRIECEEFDECPTKTNRNAPFTILHEVEYYENTTMSQTSENLVTVSRCLAEVTDGHCQVSLSYYFLSIVVVVNMLKLCCFAYLLARKQRNYLFTVGDAVNSFIRTPDSTSLDLPLASYPSLRERAVRLNRDHLQCFTAQQGQVVERGSLGGRAADENRLPKNRSPFVQRIARVDWLWRLRTTSYLQASSHDGHPTTALRQSVKLSDFSTFQKEPGTIGCVSPRSVGCIDEARRPPAATIWSNSKRTWFLAASSARSLLTTGFCLALWGVAFMLLCFYSSPDSGTKFDFSNFGQITLSTYIFPVNGARHKSLTANVILTNLPQLLLSVAYAGISGIFSTMLGARELHQYSRHRKGLRVSRPTGSQRSTYWLSIPLRFGIPLAAMMSLLHWAVSESIFIVSIVNYYANGNLRPESNASKVGCGWSPPAVLISLIFGALITASLMGMGFLRYSPSMPLLSTCSLAISAACHRASYEVPEIATMPLMFGEVNEEIQSGARRACFSARPVKPLQVGASYANA